MKLKRLLVFISIIFFAISFKFPDALELLSTKVKAIPLEVSINSMDADTEVRSAEEFETVMTEGIREAKDSIRARIVNYNEKDYDVNVILNKILNENAELGFASGCNIQLTRNMDNGTAVIEIRMRYAYPREIVVSMRERTNSIANDIIKNIIKPEMNEYERVLTVHDYLIKNSRYDKLNASKNTVPPEEHEAYGVLVKGIGVCDSYSKAMKLLLEKTGVYCLIVEGSKAGNTIQSLDDVDHAWNIVRIDGEYYHVDTTWNDVNEGKGSINMVYHHFNLNDTEMQKTHIWERSKYPKCTGTKYNYYIYNKLTANNHEETLSILENAITSKDEKLLVKIENYKKSAYNIEELIKKAAANSRIRKSLGAKWIVNDSLGIVDLEFTY
jgi:hypothetical protein